MEEANIFLRALDLNYARERFDTEAADWPRWLELFQAHADELRKFDALKLDIDVDWYHDMQRQHRLFLFGARDADGVLQGYSSYYTHRHPHYRRLWCAQDDAIYVVPERRRLGIGMKLRQLNLYALKEAGIKFVTARDKYAHELDESLDAMGFKLWERCWAREL
jgi:GNAT superfamily N-acetyltransferase